MKKLALGVAVAAAVVIAVHAQAPPAFEVATVKMNKAGGPGSFIRRLPGGRVETTNFPLRQMIIFAYQLAQFQIVGGPSWITTDRFDVVAKMEGGDPPLQMPGSGPDAIQLALRGFLADRFKLKVHNETRDMDIYALVVAKPGQLGPALKPAATDCAALAAARRGQPPQGPPAANEPVKCGIMGGPGLVRFGGFPLSQVTTMLGAMTGRMVVDRTGLKSNWDFELRFAADQRGQPLPPGVDLPAADPDAPSLYTAIQEQLGLKLESTKGPVEVLVIDSVDHPTDD